MANITQVEVNGTTYDICDAVARDSIDQRIQFSEGYEINGADTADGSLRLAIKNNGSTPEKNTNLIFNKKGFYVNYKPVNDQQEWSSQLQVIPWLPNWNNYISITATSYANAYICPSNGYVFAYNAANTSSYVQISSYSSDYGPAIGVMNGRDSIYVLRNTKVYIVGSFGAVRFFPFVS